MLHGWTEDKRSASTITSIELSAKSFDRLARFITGELGIKMPDSKLSMIQSRLLRRARELRLRSLEEYSEYFFENPTEEERQCLINAVTTNKTDFFREPTHFTFLTEVALPNVLQMRRGNAMRTNVWSAACSSGEEPYTLAMVLSDFAATRLDFSFAILATDISTRVLDRARKAIYSGLATQPIPEALRRKYLLQSRDHSSDLVRVAPALRGKVSFHQMNLMEDSYPVRDRFDIIFCRNVLIYFDRPTQEAVLTKLCRKLNPGGYLFVGHSESLSGMQLPVRQVSTAVFRMPTAEETR